MTRLPYRTVLDAPERAEIRETHARLRREAREARAEVRRLRKLVRALAYVDHYAGECECKGCQAQREARKL